MKATGLTVTANDITLTGFTAAVAGNAATPAGTNGTYKFTVTLTLGASSAQTAEIQCVIAATPYNITAPPTGNDNVSQSNMLKGYVQNSTLYVTGLSDGQSWQVYSLSGILIYQGIAKGDKAEVALPNRGMYIIISENKSIKVMN